MRAFLIWVGLGLACLVPLALSLTSPLLAWRDPIYVASGVFGVLAMAGLLVQPALMSGQLPGLSALQGRRIHRWTGALLLLSVVLHVVGLWITSPPDVVDALLFRSPTTFSVWGVMAMWALFATAALALFKRRWRISPRTWRLGHGSLAVVIVMGSIVHALLIDGTMEVMSKVALSALVGLATLYTLSRMKLRRTPVSPNGGSVGRHRP